MAKKEVSSKDKKSDILSAYEDALKEIKALKHQNTSQAQTNKAQQAEVQKAVAETPDKLINAISTVKVTVTKSLDELTEKLLEQQEKLASIQKAIAVQDKLLSDKYAIQSELDSLEAMVAAHSKMKKDMQHEMETLRQSWQQEKQQTEKSRQREDDEYQYSIAQQRKRDEDAHTLKKQMLEHELKELKVKAEQEFAAREKSLTENEEELTRLREEAALFPDKLAGEVQQAIEKTHQEVEQQYAHQASLFEAQTEGKIALYKQTNAGLVEKIKEQKDMIEQLSKKATFASDQVQSIAVKAIEGAARRTESVVIEKAQKEPA